MVDNTIAISEETYSHSFDERENRGAKFSHELAEFLMEKHRPKQILKDVVEHYKQSIYADVGICVDDVSRKLDIQPESVIAICRKFEDFGVLESARMNKVRYYRPTDIGESVYNFITFFEYLES